MKIKQKVLYRHFDEKTQKNSYYLAVIQKIRPGQRTTYDILLENGTFYTHVTKDDPFTMGTIITKSFKKNVESATTNLSITQPNYKNPKDEVSEQSTEEVS